MDIIPKTYNWTVDDIVCGRIVCKTKNASPFIADGWTAKWTFKIGWNPSDSNLTKGESYDPQYCLICLTDGMVCPCKKNKQEIADWLNKNIMIPMPKDWIMATMKYLLPLYDKECSL